ncbi:MAG: adenosylmethionine--8-amino-7-oxononanoate transaminase [Bdellovibrionales bacterium]|nr:adenosylmethionine--8-amino-7-oxononanoate transaminase [Bdellovibrionales bacterium]
MSISERDAGSVWHPYTQHGIEPIVPSVARAAGTKLILEDGRELIDAISSWWVNLHGHAHPAIAEAITTQAQLLEQVIFAGFTHEPAVSFAERLLAILPKNQKRVFYSDNGSTAVEAAIKMALQYHRNIGRKNKRILFLENGYHGDTFGAMSVSSRGPFTKPFSSHLFPATPIPVPTSDTDPNPIESLEKELREGDVAAFIFEPLVQGAGGMNIYPASALDQMVSLCKKYEALTIADEVMTGFGRTGALFASLNLSSAPDIMCFSKGITGGFMALGATTCTDEIFQAFLSESRTEMLFHGHSFTANPLALAAANASMTLLLTQDCRRAREQIALRHQGFIESLRGDSAFERPRTCGVILAVNLISAQGDSGYLSSLRDQIYRLSISRGVLLRPLGNVVYILPPYCISESELDQCHDTIRAIGEMVSRNEHGDR